MKCFNMTFFSSDGNWGEWSEYYECSVTCGEGKQTRNRSCDNPVPENGGLSCIGDREESQSCIQKPCPISKLLKSL